MEIPLFLYNSFSRTKEAFRPLDMNNVRMYVCGPTVYDRAHIGNARPVLVFDILFRLLRYLYGKDKVTYVRNITDIDDKINAKALERGVNIDRVTEETIEWFHKDMDFLGALRPNYEPRATAYVSQMIDMVTKLISLSFAYPSEDGHVFFEVEKFADYGQLSNKKLGELKEGVRIENENTKKNPLDFKYKVKTVRKFFPKHARSVMLDKKVKTVFDAVTEMYNDGFKNISMVVGSDRINEFNALLKK